METNDMGGKYLLPLAVIVAGLLIAGAVVWNSARPAGPGQVDAGSVDVAQVKSEGNPFIGQADAPLTIAFWSDFQCPYCRSVEVGGVPQIPTPPAVPDIIKDYVDTGKVKLLFMDFVFLGEDSTAAALYGRSVWKLYPDKYFAWRTAMYTAQDEEGDKGFGDPASIDQLNATIPGIDAAKVAADVQANRDTYQVAIDSDRAEASKAGISATPSFVIGTQLLSGAYPYATFKEAIDAELK